MALSSGEDGFDELVLCMQKRINNILAITSSNSAEIKAFTAGNPTATNLLENIGHDWHTIMAGWQEDRILRNFEFHCHLVEIIRRAIVCAIEQQRNAAVRPLSLSPENVEHASIESVFAALLAHIESLAMLRGLSTSAAVIKACGEHSHARIAFLLREIPRCNQDLLQTLKSYPAHPLHSSGLEFLRNEQVTVHKFLINIQLVVLDQRRSADSQELFELGTRIVDSHWQIFDQGINALECQLLQGAIDMPSENNELARIKRGYATHY